MRDLIHTERKIRLLDGAMGTMLQRRLGTVEGPAELLNLSHPELIADIHREYIAAGADIIETNTFNANRISLAAHGLSGKAREMALAGAQIARKAADDANAGPGTRRIQVAGSVGPTSRSLTLPSDIGNPALRETDFDTLATAYREQIEALVEGGIDILLIETCFDALNAKAALYALQQVAPGFPAIVSVSVADRSGRTLTGQTLEAFYHSVRHYPLTAFGLNCSLGAEQMLPLVREVARFSEFPVICYPNAGLPNEEGGYDQTPEQMAQSVGEMLREGLVSIVGGCCGSTPEHISYIADMLLFEGALPPTIPRGSRPSVSGLEAHAISGGGTGFIPVGERTNVAGSRKFARLIGSGAYDETLQIAAAQVNAGAGIIDINMDDAMLDAPVEMERFLRHIAGEPAAAGAALMIDSSDWKTVLAGLKNAQGRSIVNSISLKEGEEAMIAKAREIHALGAAMVVMAFDEEGQAVTYERKIAIAERSYHILTEKAGIPPEDIIFDCNILSVGTGIAEHARYGIDFIEAVRWIKQHLPGALTSGGVSNLSFAFRGNNPLREAMHSVFLYHAVRAGLDMAIVNPSALVPYEEIDPKLREAVEDLILCRREDATERLMEVAAGMTDSRDFKAVKDGAGEAERPGGEDAEAALADCIVRGSSEALEDLVEQCRIRLGSAGAVVEGPLMAGMETVGKRFGEGKMFLPQVVKSARTMREAVALLEPWFTPGENTGRERKRIVLATVKGDVHDIGKNITGIVLRCNGFEVHDLGVMVEGERILAEAERTGADIIAVSGLITPSLYQMEQLCREMALRDMDTPLLIGGATTSAVHTAVKLAPLYGHVFYCADASESAVTAGRLMLDREGTEAALHQEQARLRALREGRSPAPGPETAPAVSKNIASCTPSDRHSAPVSKNEAFCTQNGLREIDPAELLPLFDERMYLAIWGIPYGKADINAPAIRDTLLEARSTLERMIRRHEVRITLSARFPEGVHREEDGLDWIDGYEGGRRICSLPTLRDAKGRCLADLLPTINRAGSSIGEDLSERPPQGVLLSEGTSSTSTFGLFAIAVHPTLKHPAACDCPACGGLTERTIRLTLAEAASEWFEARIRACLDDPSLKIIKPAAGYAACPDHTLKKDILGLLEDPGITLTDSCAMIPDASICALVFFHPDAAYPDIRRISPETAARYAAARGFSPEQTQQFLGHLI